jgi:hypothetical protein
MTSFTDLASVPSDPVVPFTGPLRLAAAAYLARFKGSSREHTESDLRCYLAWCAERHRVLRVCGKGTKVVLVPLPPAVGRAIDRAIASRVRGPILLNTRGARMDRHAATRQLHRLAEAAGIQTARAHPHIMASGT